MLFLIILFILKLLFSSFFYFYFYQDASAVVSTDIHDVLVDRPNIQEIYKIDPLSNLIESAFRLYVPCHFTKKEVMVIYNFLFRVALSKI